MQVLKEEVKNRILSSARAEFLEKGYNKASMRSISSLAGITVGNLYRYFKNKEVLFSEVVEPAYNMSLEIIDKFRDFSNLDSHTAHEIASKNILDIFYLYSQELIILMDGSQGTKFEHTIEQFVEIIQGLMNNVIKDVHSADNRIIEPDSFILNIIARGYLDGLSSIMKSGLSNNEIEEKVRVYNRFIFQDFCERFKED